MSISKYGFRERFGPSFSVTIRALDDNTHNDGNNSLSLVVKPGMLFVPHALPIILVLIVVFVIVATIVFIVLILPSTKFANLFLVGIIETSGSST